MREPNINSWNMLFQFVLAVRTRMISLEDFRRNDPKKKRFMSVDCKLEKQFDRQKLIYNLVIASGV